MLIKRLSPVFLATIVTANIFYPHYVAQANRGKMILEVVKGAGIILGTVFSAHQAAKAADERLNRCPDAGHEFNLPVNAWVGGDSGYYLGYTSYQTVAVFYPNSAIQQTRNVYTFPANKWVVLPNTPYAFCVNGNDKLVRARWEYRLKQ